MVIVQYGWVRVRREDGTTKSTKIIVVLKRKDAKGAKDAKVFIGINRGDAEAFVFGREIRC